MPVEQMTQITLLLNYNNTLYIINVCYQSRWVVNCDSYHGYNVDYNDDDKIALFYIMPSYCISYFLLYKYFVLSEYV